MKSDNVAMGDYILLQYHRRGTCSTFSIRFSDCRDRCFFQEDEYGLQNRTLLCLARPSGLQEDGDRS